MRGRLCFAAALLLLWFWGVFQNTVQSFEADPPRVKGQRSSPDFSLLNQYETASGTACCTAIEKILKELQIVPNIGRFKGTPFTENCLSLVRHRPPCASNVDKQSTAGSCWGREGERSVKNVSCRSTAVGQSASAERRAVSTNIYFLIIVTTEYCRSPFKPQRGQDNTAGESSTFLPWFSPGYPWSASAVRACPPLPCACLPQPSHRW